ARDMQTAWLRALSTVGTTVPDDGATRAEQATADTPLAEAGLTPRALSALEPFGVHTVGELAAVDKGRLARISGVADVTRREVRSRAKQWRERIGPTVRPAAQSPPDVVVSAGTALDDPELTATALLEAAGTRRARARRKAASVLLGLEAD